MELPYPANVARALQLVRREVRVKFSDFIPQVPRLGGVGNRSAYLGSASQANSPSLNWPTVQSAN